MRRAILRAVWTQALCPEGLLRAVGRELLITTEPGDENLPVGWVSLAIWT